MSLPQIMILGAGLGGTIAACEIRDAVKGKAQVMAVNERPAPLLAEPHAGQSDMCAGRPCGGTAAIVCG